MFWKIKMKIKITCLALIAFLTLPVFAHEGVKNDAVKQRMQLMKVIKNTMAEIGAMARGLDPFNEESAANAKQTLLLAAADIEAKFKLNETDPLSEGSPAIWENWEDFVEKSDDFSFMIEGLETSSADTLAAGLGNIGQSCGSCHKAYRIK